jgi:hypothetical protein
MTGRGRPVLTLAPYSADPAEALRALRGSVCTYERPLDPVGIEDWKFRPRSCSTPPSLLLYMHQHSCYGGAHGRHHRSSVGLAGSRHP